jgi:predicted nucleic acid-binding protein
MEVMEGAHSKANQAQCRTLLDQFELLYLTAADQQWAIQQVEHFQFSHHIGKDDCLIAAVAYRLQVPLYTHNLKHMTPMIDALALKPYP